MALDLTQCFSCETGYSNFLRCARMCLEPHQRLCLVSLLYTSLSGIVEFKHDRHETLILDKSS